MPEETTDRQSAPQPSAGEAWGDVVVQLDALAAAVARWSKAAVNDPDYRRHANEFANSLRDMGSKAAEVVDDAAQS
ncbi:MAG: hypothetical protein FDZ75_04855, partial [Actinobacteria bacterium]